MIITQDMTVATELTDDEYTPSIGIHTLKDLMEKRYSVVALESATNPRSPAQARLVRARKPPLGSATGRGPHTSGGRQGRCGREGRASGVQGCGWQVHM